MEAHDRFRVLPAGDGAFVLELGGSIDPSMSQLVLALHNAIMKNPPAGLVSSQPTFRSISVQFDPQVTDGVAVLNAISKPYKDETSEQREPTRWKIPACYDPSMGLDCNSIADQTKLEPSEFARRHSGTDYLVYMLGGFPGYPFMGDVDKDLRVGRLKAPRTQVPPGSIAVAGQFTAIYPRATPGGWCIVGRTPVEIFDTTREQPALFSPGDTVSFSPVSLIEFSQISTKLRSGEIGVQTFAVNGS